MLTHNSLVCCGLDPVVDRMPSEYASLPTAGARVAAFLKEVIEITSPHVVAYKVQKAFFDPFPNASDLLHTIVEFARERAPHAVLIVDSKAGDIANTMDAYFDHLIGNLGFDSIVVNPYMGADVWAALSRYPESACIVLVRTSNASAEVIQHCEMHDGRPLWQYILDIVAQEWAKGFTLVPVLSSEAGPGLASVRSIAPEGMPIFFAGVGAQGGSLRPLAHLLNANGSGVLVNSARALLYPYERTDTRWREAIETAVRRLRAEVDSARS